jgi:hypothetical protein
MDAEKKRLLLSYDYSKSKTAGTPDKTTATHNEFGSGSLDGMFTTDLCRIGSNGHFLSLKDFNFGMVLVQNNIFDRGGNFDAIVGMAYKPLANEG